MKKLLFTIVTFSFIFWFSGCNEDSLVSSGIDDITTLNKAGTALKYPNTFAANGDLCTLGDNVLLGTLNTPMEIWMGVGNEKAGTLVGRVTFDGADVIIDLTDADNDGVPDMYPYVVTLVHADFAGEYAGLPQTKSGNPIPGQFEFHKEANPYATQLILEGVIDIDFDKVGAIHMEVVKYGGLEGFEFYLPNDLVTMKITASSDSYVKLQIMNGGFISEYNGGFYEAWCFAKDLSIYYNRTYDAYLYSSYENIPEVVLIKANITQENLDNANWLMNNYNVGGMVDGVSLTVDDIQHALWNLINGKNFLDPQVLTMVEEALKYDGFEPGCDDKIIFIAVPSDPEMTPDAQLIIGQPIIAEIEVPCETSGGTAWGDGYYGATFDGKQWGAWFNYNTCD